MIGGIVAASVCDMMNTDMISGRTKRKMIRGGRNLLRKTGHIMNEVSEMFR